MFVFNGALGGRHLGLWDPFLSPPDNDCPVTPECLYDQVKTDMEANGLFQPQVQVIFLYTSTAYPHCAVDGTHCYEDDPPGTLRDIDRTQIYLKDILHYLKQGRNGSGPRYPNLKQVFLVSRNYAGYARNSAENPYQGCLSPEPFSYEMGFAVQRTVVAQIQQTQSGHSGPLDYNSAPWFDWGPYLWADGENPRNADQLKWCNDNGLLCAGFRDFRWGDDSSFIGDLTHPAKNGQGKAANLIVNFLLNSAFTNTWIHK